MSDLFEGDDETRAAVCDWSGHDWLPNGGADVCLQCGAMQTAQRFDAPGCQMCGAPDGEPCDCHDPQA